MHTTMMGTRALVCGSSAGIGKSTAVALATLGAEVVLLARDPGKLEAVRSQLPTPAGQKHGQLAADFARPEGVRAVVAELVASSPVHVLVNNTGGPPGGPLLDAQASSLVEAFAAHVLASHALVQACVPAMKQAKFGRIINIISTSVKAPIPGLGVSNTIRGAMASWAKTLAGELGPFGITVNNVLPGFTSTDRLDTLISARAGASGQSREQIADAMRASIPLGRFARPEEIADAVAFLAGPAGSYVTGINLPVDGGRLPTL